MSIIMYKEPNTADCTTPSFDQWHQMEQGVRIKNTILMIKLYFLFILQEYYIHFSVIVSPFACFLDCLNWPLCSDWNEDSSNVMVRGRRHSLESKRTYDGNIMQFLEWITGFIVKHLTNWIIQSSKKQKQKNKPQQTNIGRLLHFVLAKLLQDTCRSGKFLTRHFWYLS